MLYWTRRLEWYCTRGSMEMESKVHRWERIVKPHSAELSIFFTLRGVPLFHQVQFFHHTSGIDWMTLNHVLLALVSGVVLYERILGNEKLAREKGRVFSPQWDSSFPPISALSSYEYNSRPASAISGSTSTFSLCRRKENRESRSGWSIHPAQISTLWRSYLQTLNV